MFFELTLIKVFVTLASFIYKWAIILAVFTGPALSLMKNHPLIVTLFHGALPLACIRTTYLQVIVNYLSQISIDITQL